MKIIRAKDYLDMSRKAANIISAQVIMKPDCVLGLATGGTPVGTYRQLVEWYDKGDLDFSEVSTVNLDEYRGLPRENDQSYWYFMNENLFRKVNVDPARIHLPDGTNLDSEGECKRYDQVICRLGGIDLQLLGIGPNGHIGFNEPGAAFELETHCVDLTEETIEANKRFFASREQVPRQAYTMGIKSIMQARKILVVANGAGKARAVREAVAGPVTPKCPASILQIHPDCTLVADEEALSLL
ncbi:MAG: glucosamine-6-phosphate deaminase [Gemmiger sp.]